MAVSLLALVLGAVVQGHPSLVPVAESTLVVSGENPNGGMTVIYREDGRRTRKTVVGRLWNLEYDLDESVVRDTIIEHFVAETDRLRGVIHREAGNRLTFTFMREDGGETWCQVWATDGNYTLEMVDEPPPGHESFKETARPHATIVFDRGASELDDDAERTLDAMADWLELHPDLQARVRGHRGPLEDPALPEARANVVAEALRFRGIPEERVVAAEDPSNQGFEVTVAAERPPPPPPPPKVRLLPERRPQLREPR